MTRTIFALWVLIACPAIGATTWWVADTDGDAIGFALFLGLPAALALAGSVALRQEPHFAALGAFLAAVVGLVTLLIIVGLVEGS